MNKWSARIYEAFANDMPMSDLLEVVFHEGRADAIDEFKTDIINKINFEEKWLFDCKSNNADTNIAYSALRTFVENRAEQLKSK